MPLDISREIGTIRAKPGWNWLAGALQRIQDYANSLPTTASTTSTTTTAPTTAATSTPATAVAATGSSSPSFAPSTIQLAGDVTGANTATTVAAVQGNIVKTGVPSDGQVLEYVTANTDWEPSTIGGDVSGNPKTLTVAKIQNIAVKAGTPSNGQVLTYVAANTDWEAKSPIGVNTVAFSATPAFDVSLGNVQEITLTANVTSFTITNAVAGQVVKFIWIQNATGGWTVSSPPANMHGFTAPGTTASTWSIQTATYDGTNWICETANTNIA